MKLLGFELAQNEVSERGMNLFVPVKLVDEVADLNATSASEA